jgi:adenylate cyclase
MCTSCQNYLIRYHGGAEVDATMLFADVRGSTALAERTSPSDYRALLDRFYTVAADTVFAHSGVVDKFVGDELVAAFPPNLGTDHVARGIEAARSLLRATGHADPGGPWIPLGAGVHTGRVWFGAVGEGTRSEIAMLGDPVNVTARLASLAAAGEILVSADAATAAGVGSTLPRRSLQLKGKHEPVEAVTLTVGPPAATR